MEKQKLLLRENWRNESVSTAAEEPPTGKDKIQMQALPIKYSEDPGDETDYSEGVTKINGPAKSIAMKTIVSSNPDFLISDLKEVKKIVNKLED